MTSMRTVAFARVSSKTQEEEGYSLDAQLKTLRSYCADKKLKIVTEFRISETATKDEQRTVFKQMMVYVAQNNITHLAVEKTDRLTRNLRDAVVVDDWLEANQNRRLHMVKEGLVVHKYAKSDERLMWNIYLALSRKYTDTLREEAMKGWSEKLAQGWMPSPPPPGYKSAKENGKKIHVIDEDKAFLVERAFRLYLEPGQNVLTVRDEVSRCGLVTRKDKPLGKSAIHKMLRNTFYVGIIRFNNKEYPGAHEPLIDSELFQAVQAKLGERGHTKLVDHNPLFKGLLQCITCSAMITWQLQKGRYYGACQRRNDACKGYRLLRQDRLEEEIFQKLHEIDQSGNGRKILGKLKVKLEERQQPYIGEHRVLVIKMLKQQIRRLERIEDNLYDDKLAGVIDDNKYAAKKERLAEELGPLQERLARLESIEGRISTVTAVSQQRTLVSLYLAVSKNEKRIILVNLFSIGLDRGSAVFKMAARR